MKKIYFLLMAMLVSMAANAWTVKFTNPDGWTEVAVWAWDDNNNNYTGGTWPGKLMTQEGDVWTYTGTGNPTKIIFNNNNHNQQTPDFDFVDGATYDKNGPIGAKLNEYTVYFDNSKSNWTNVYVYTFTPDVFGSWPGKKLTAGADGLYAATYEATSEYSFGGVIFNNGTGGTQGVDQTYDLAWETGATYNVNGKDNGDTPTPGYTNWYVNVLYTNNDMADNGLKPNAEGLSIHKDLKIGDAGFKIKVYNGADLYYTAAGTIATGEWVQLYKDDYDQLTFIEGATAESAYNVEFNCANNMVKVTLAGGDTPTPQMPDHVYVVGDLQAGYSWATTIEHIKEMTKDAAAGTFTIDGITFELPGAESTACYFSFITTPSTTENDETRWDEVNSGDRFGAATEGTTVTTGNTYDVTEYKVGVNASASKSWAIAPGEYKIVFNYNDMNMTIDTSTGIESVEADANVAAEYYTIMGVRVAEPKAGQIYIVKRGDKVSKMIMK